MQIAITVQIQYRNGYFLFCDFQGVQACFQFYELGAYFDNGGLEPWVPSQPSSGEKLTNVTDKRTNWPGKYYTTPSFTFAKIHPYSILSGLFSICSLFSGRRKIFIKSIFKSLLSDILSRFVGFHSSVTGIENLCCRCIRIIPTVDIFDRRMPPLPWASRTASPYFSIFRLGIITDRF